MSFVFSNPSTELLDIKALDENNVVSLYCVQNVVVGTSTGIISTNHLYLQNLDLERFDDCIKGSH